MAIENLWLAARAEGVGVGWVSFYREDDLRALLGIPAHATPVAWLCVGYPDERPSRPGLEVQGWGRRDELARHVMLERWTGSNDSAATPSGAIAPADASAAIRTRDASDQLVKPAGSLGALEAVLERWAAATGTTPTGTPTVGVLVLAGDHGVAARGVSLYPDRVSAQVAAAAARGETAIGVLARALNAELIIADIGLRGPKVAGVRDLRVADGTADLCSGPAMTGPEARRAIDAGFALGTELAARCELVVLGEIGIGNTTVASALLAALTGLPAEGVCGRGTGLDSQGVERKRFAVAAALAANPSSADDPLGCLAALGGLEFAGLVGAMLGIASRRRMALLDGFAVGVAALVACRLEPAARDYLIAGHRSAEPAHQIVLTELGLEPLLDLRMRLGEASGAALAVPLIGLTARLHSEMARFEDAMVDRAE